MAISKGHRFPITFDDAFPLGLLLMGDVSPDTDFQSREERAAGRQLRQRVDESTGLRRWKATVTDPGEPNAKRASFTLTFLAGVAPVPTTSEVLPGVRPIALEGLMVEPKVAGNGEFKYQSYAFFASGFAAAATGSGKAPAKPVTGGSAEKSAAA